MVSRFLRDREFLRQVKPATLKFYRERINDFLRPCKEWPPSHQSVVDYLTSKSAKGWKAVSVNCAIRALRAFFSWAIEEELLEKNPMKKIKLLPVERKVLRTVSVEDIQRILDAARKNKRTGTRDAAIILFMVTTGVRPGELCSLNVGDLDLREMSARVRGKSGGHIVYFSEPTKRAIVKYLKESRRLDPGEILFPSRKGGRLTPNALDHLCTRLEEDTGVRVYPYLLRHTMATELLREGKPVEYVSRQLGHAPGSRVTQETYAHLIGDDIAKMVQSSTFANRLK
jgi:site-specific recombinase XerD